MLGFDKKIVRDQQGKIMMPIVETFLSLNGEGLQSGKPSMFIRLQGCNLRCKYDDKTGLCDTPEALAFPERCSKSNYKYKTAQELAQEIKLSKVKRICLTGGEPLARNGIAEFIKDLQCELDCKVNIEIETNGSINLEDTFKNTDINMNNISFTLDYKSKSSGEEFTMDLTNWSTLREYDAIKFVVCNKQEMEKAVFLLKKYKPKAQPIFSPVFGKIDLKDIWEYTYSKEVIELDIKVQIQLHKIAYDSTTRGV